MLIEAQKITKNISFLLLWSRIDDNVAFLLTDHTATKAKISSDYSSIEKEIKTKEEELAKLKNKLAKRKQDMNDIKMKIKDEEASREKMAEKLGDFESIVKLFHSV